MQDKAKQKPTIEQVLEYAKKQVKFYISSPKFGGQSLTPEQKEEVYQDACLRLWAKYSELDPALGWQSFTQKHCFGALMDYLKSGLKDTESEFSQERVEIVSKEDGSTLSLDDTAGFFGVHTELDLIPKGFNPRWDLINRLIGKHEDLHIIAKCLNGYTQDQIAEQLAMVKTNVKTEVSRERISQRIREFFEKLDDPAQAYNPVVNQFIFALGLSSFYHMSEVDNGYGWDFFEFDSNMETSFVDVKNYYEPSFNFEAFQ